MQQGKCDGGAAFSVSNNSCGRPGTADVTQWQQAHLEVLVHEVEKQQDGPECWQRKGHDSADDDDGGGQLHAAANEEGREVCQILVHIRCVLGQAINDAPLGRGVEKRHWRPTVSHICP